MSTIDQATHRAARVELLRATLASRIQAVRQAPLFEKSERADEALEALLQLQTEQQQLNSLLLQALRESLDG